MENILKKITDYKWELPKSYKSGMRVPAYFYVSRKLMQILERDAVEQAANVATMPGIQKASLIMPDVHVGYGFPIGGVAAFDTDEGVVSPGGVGFDINCLAPGSKILTEHGYWINVEELPEKLEMQGIKVYNVNEGHNDSSEVAFVSEREIKNGEAAFRIITEGGRILESSGDHPILTSEGYKPAGKVSEGDYVIVYPFDGVEYEEKTETILTEEDLKKYDSQVLKYLRDRSLLPLRLDNPEIGTLARILGFAFGDGSLHWEVGNDKKRLILSFYGKKEELNEIRNDLMKIGVKASRIYTRKRKVSMKTPWDEYESKCTEAMIKVTSKAFALLMHRLGMPVGKKGIQPYCVPEWVRNAPKWVKRNFLAGLFGADGSVVFFKKHTPLPISLTQRRSIEFRENLLEFLGDIAEMLKEFRVNSIIYKIKSLDGKITYRLSIAGEENIKHFLGQINYEYSSDKKTRGLLGYEYLRRKEEVKKIRRLAVEEAKKAYLDNKSPSKAYEAVKGEYINRRLVERGLYENPVEIRISKDFPTFDEFVREFGDRGGFVTDRVIRIESIAPNYNKFYDIGVFHDSHNFIANGITVHNCGVRLLRSNLKVDDVRDRTKNLIDELFVAVPSGVGSEGRLRVTDKELDEIFVSGANWAVENGYGTEKDLEHCEENGALEGGRPEVVSKKARSRGRPQLGTLGSGNHFLEVQYVDKIFDEKAAKVMGLEKGMVTIMIHCGSRGLGHQVCSDFLEVLDRAVKKYGIKLPDRQLACAPITSREGQDYFAGMAASANYAWANRQIITHWVRESFRKIFKMSDEDLEMRLIYDVAHNIAKFEEHKIDGKKKVCVHRKGATRAFAGNEIPSDYRDIGQPVLIPGSMGTPSYVLRGTEKAMDETFGSTCHGSGRVMSRAEAKRKLRGDRIASNLGQKGIYIRATQRALLAEEAPEAYKLSDDVVDVVHRAGISSLVARLIPLGVAKG